MNAHTLLRSLIPSFRFFDQPDIEPQLHIRIHSQQDWQDALAPPPLKWYGLFYNPRWAEHHALSNALKNLLQDPLDSERLPQLTGFQILKLLLLARLYRQGCRAGEAEVRIQLRGEDILSFSLELA